MANKQETVKAVAEKTGYTQVDVAKVIDALEDFTHETLAKGEKVQLTGFFTVKPVFRAKRKGYDPIKLQAMDIPESVGVSIKAGEKLRKAVDGLDVESVRPEAKEVAVAEEATETVEA